MQKDYETFVEKLEIGIYEATVEGSGYREEDGSEADS